MTERGLLLGLACVGFGVALLATLFTGPSLLGALLAAASLAGLVVGLWLLVDFRRAQRTAPVQPPKIEGQFQTYRTQLRPLDQAEYAALLRADAALRARFTKILGRLDITCVRCRASANFFTVNHPVWDGPFDDAGSGVVDTRAVYWCEACDGPMPPERDGAPVRLPYLDNLPIRLLPELYERPAFHRLPIAPECYVAPPPKPADEAGHTDKETAS